MPPMRHRFAIFAALLAGLLSADAASHDLPPERRAIVDVGPSSARVLLIHQQPDGDEVALLFRKYDINGDGDLTGEEANFAAREWLPRMLHGLQFEVAGERPRALEPALKFRREDDDALTVAALIEWELPALQPGHTRTFHARLLLLEGALDTLVELRPADGLKSTTDTDEHHAKTVLTRGAQITLVARLADEEDTSLRPQN